ncbi:hypothetical protein T484DRAFT_1755406 [Baffinella frigidus]|nr:hypothetical protein T484DRAFT_1755406 [Cryptophyta sp. CCMP2293]
MYAAGAGRMGRKTSRAAEKIRKGEPAPSSPTPSAHLTPVASRALAPRSPGRLVRNGTNARNGTGGQQPDDNAATSESTRHLSMDLGALSENGDEMSWGDEAEGGSGSAPREKKAKKQALLRRQERPPARTLRPLL